MSNYIALTSQEIEAVFASEIAAVGGTVHDTFNDGRRLFARSILPFAREVRPKDQMQGGVALRAHENDVWVHPYLFREVCRNGAIMADTIETVHIEFNWTPSEDAELQIRATIRQCADRNVFNGAIRQVKTATEAAADMALNLMPHLGRMAPELADSIMRQLAQIAQRFTNENDLSRFGLMNAVTSLARDTRDPEVRWGLEELGGAIAVTLTPPAPVDAAARELVVA